LQISKRAIQKTRNQKKLELVIAKPALFAGCGNLPPGEGDSFVPRCDISWDSVLENWIAITEIFLICEPSIKGSYLIELILTNLWHNGINPWVSGSYDQEWTFGIGSSEYFVYEFHGTWGMGQGNQA
jgi:hypothetical protein